MKEKSDVQVRVFDQVKSRLVRLVATKNILIQGEPVDAEAVFDIDEETAFRLVASGKSEFASAVQIVLVKNAVVRRTAMHSGRVLTTHKAHADDLIQAGIAVVTKGQFPVRSGF